MRSAKSTRIFAIDELSLSVPKLLRFVRPVIALARANGLLLGEFASSRLTDRGGRGHAGARYFRPASAFHARTLKQPAKEMKVMKKTNDVGYGRPPIEHRFKPGESGNPSGRPKDARRFAADLLDELGEMVSITDGNKTLEVTKQRAIVKRWSAKPSAASRVRSRPSSVRAPATVGDQEIDDQAEAPEDRAIMRAVAESSAKNANSLPAKKSNEDNNE